MKKIIFLFVCFFLLVSCSSPPTHKMVDPKSAIKHINVTIKIIDEKNKYRYYMVSIMSNGSTVSKGQVFFYV